MRQVPQYLHISQRHPPFQAILGEVRHCFACACNDEIYRQASLRIIKKTNEETQA